MQDLQDRNDLEVKVRKYNMNEMDLFQLSIKALHRLGYRRRREITCPGQYNYYHQTWGILLKYGKSKETPGQLNFLEKLS